MIGKVLGPEILGIYDVMKQLLMRPEALVNPAVCQVTLPLMAARRDDAVFVKKTYLDSLRLMATANFPIYVACFVLAQPLLAVILSGPWAANADVFRILAVFYLLHATFNPIGALQMAKARADLGFYWNLALLFTLPVAVGIGVWYGLNGVGWALLVFLVMSYVPFFRFFLRPLLPDLQVREYVQPFLKPLSCAVASAAVVSPLLFMGLEPWLTLFLGGLLGGYIYFFFFQVFDFHSIK
jgi:O-antigen/teichoic acid export membrane protein